MDHAGTSDFDRHMMTIALAQARRGLGRTAPNPSVGAVVADEATGELIAAASTAPGGRPHAEPTALAEAGARAHGKTLYVTLEPCSHHGATPPCVDAVIGARLGRVVVALEDPDPRVSGRGLERLRRAGIAVSRGLGAQEAHWIARGHILRVTERRPLVQIKLACDAAGDIPRGAGGTPRFVTGELARQRGHLLRAQADAILVGRRTVTDDDPDLTCRLPGLAARSPIRVVLSHTGAGLAQSRLARSAGVHPLWAIVGAPAAADADAAALTAEGIRVIACPLVGGALWLPAVAEALVREGVTRLLVEGGPSTWRAFSAAGLVDEVVVFHARGDSGLAIGEAAAREAIRRHVGGQDLELVEARPLGGDDMLVFRVRWRGILRRAGAAG
jgi:diaminohydroxyphosphoribosylaminopyrimidine deaminase/5-amino-6-(5-phosphoribosylamino)uracil reductase